MTIGKRTAALFTAALLAASSLPAVPVCAEIDLQNLPVPLYANSSSEEAKAFAKSKPKLVIDGCVLMWKPVKSALYYIVYRDDGKGMKKLYSTLDTSYSIYGYGLDGAEYCVRAVTFTGDDKMKMSDFSNTVYAAGEESADAGNDSDDSYEDWEDEESDYDDISDSGDSSAGAPPEYSEEPEYEEESESADASAGLPSEYDEELTDAVYIPNTEEYTHSEESGYKNAALNPLSTFSADVDTASYSNLRRLINQGKKIPADAVRIEEMLNYFDYGYKAPSGDSLFSIDAELTDCPWNDGAQLLKVGIQGKDMEKAPDSNLVFLIDTSGSMSWNNSLETALKCVKMLSKTMSENDRISIVTYSGEERVILAGAKGNQVKAVSAMTSLLNSGGSTNGESGIQAAYAIAEKYFISGGNNRIILCTDGDLNVGISDEEGLKKLIEEKRKSGVYFSVLGFGEENIKDNKMETLADNGNGGYYYIDTAKEAAKVLIEERNSTLYTIAKDVKIQLEFNPEAVKGYRLIGYDNRRLADEDFTDDKKDAGEVGAGSSVTALYEIIPAETVNVGADSSELVTIKVRCKNPENGRTVQSKRVVKKSDHSEKMSRGMYLACAVAEMGLVLKNSEYKGTASFAEANALIAYVTADDPNIYETELEELIRKFCTT